MTASPKRFPNELRTLAALLSNRPVSELNDREWDRFRDLVIDRHRVAPQVAPALAGHPVPERVRQEIEAEATSVSFQALAQKAETLRLVAALDAKGCQVMVLKGWPLSERLFGKAGSRAAKDIDLHIRPTDLPLAIEVLSELGYCAVRGHEGRLALARTPHPALLAETNDIAVFHPSGQMVELHWRLTHLAGWITLEDVPEAITQHPVDQTGQNLCVPDDRANLIYLSVHGQLHLWGRLRWLLDVAKLMELRSDRALGADLALAQELGAGRAVRIAMHLAHRIFHVALPSDLPPPSALERLALDRFCALIASPAGEPGRPEARLGYYLGILCLGEGPKQKLAALRYALWRNLRLFLASRMSERR